jgi:hypothetical protein
MSMVSRKNARAGLLARMVLFVLKHSCGSSLMKHRVLDSWFDSLGCEPSHTRDFFKIEGDGE